MFCQHFVVPMPQKNADTHKYVGVCVRFYRCLGVLSEAQHQAAGQIDYAADH